MEDKVSQGERLREADVASWRKSVVPINGNKAREHYRQD